MRRLNPGLIGAVAFSLLMWALFLRSIVRAF